MDFWIFTFAFDQTALNDKYVKIFAADREAARVIMYTNFKTNWAFQYNSDNEFIIEKHGLKLLIEI